MRGKYSRWGEFLKKRREAKYRSAREFCARAEVGISYPQYSRYEAGDQLPSLEQAMDLCRLLDVQPLEGLLEWSGSQVARDDERTAINTLLEKVKIAGFDLNHVHAGSATQMGEHGVAASPEDRRLASSRPTEGSRVPFPTHDKDEFVLDHLLVFNRAHLKLFLTDPRYRDVFTFINIYSPEEWVPAKLISDSLKIELELLESMLDQMNDLGLILYAGGRCRVPKTMFYYPDDEDFFELRNQNFRHNVDEALKSASFDKIREREAYRNVITRKYSRKQIEALISRIEAFAFEAVNLPDPEGDEPAYSLCLLLGERFSRADAARTSLPASEDEVRAGGLTRQLEDASEASEKASS